MHKEKVKPYLERQACVCLCVFHTRCERATAKVLGFVCLERFGQLTGTSAEMRTVRGCAGKAEFKWLGFECTGLLHGMSAKGAADDVNSERDVRVLEEGAELAADRFRMVFNEESGKAKKDDQGGTRTKMADDRQRK